ncbi:ATP-binding cassette domain-containing protein [Slackia piriformis]
MFDKRLLALVDGSGRMIAAIVGLKWIALVANIVVFVSLGLFIQQTLAQAYVIPSAASDALAGLGLSGQTLLLLCAASIAVRVATSVAAQRVSAEVSGKAKKLIRGKVYDKLVKMGPSYTERIASSQAVQMGVEGVEQLEVYFGSYLPQFFYALLAPLTLFVFLAPFSFSAALVLLVCVPLIPVSIVMFQKMAKQVMRSYWGSYLDLGGSFLENIQGLTTLKIYQADEARHELMNEQAEGFRRATMRVLRLQLNSITIMDVLAYGGAAVGICLALHQFLNGNLSFAAAFAVVFLSAEFFLPMRALGSLFHTAMNGMAAADRMFDLLDMEESEEGGRSLAGRTPRIRCEKLSYSYDGIHKVLDDVDFCVEAGQLVAVVGESGSGKSTFAGVLAGRNARFEGDVQVCDVPLQEADRASLAQTLTSVGFDGVLFKGTLRENLLMGDPHASDEEARRVLAEVGAWDFVRAKGGLDMRVAEGASNLSGGQRQRICLARALLHDAEIYVFDEVTSSIDAQSEAVILRAIYDLAERGKTVVMISHRLSSVEQADAIYVMQDGCVVQRGSHAQLMEEGGVYRRMVEQQRELERFAQDKGVGDVPFCDDAPVRRELDCEAPVRREPNLEACDSSPSAAKGNARGMSALGIVSRMIGLIAPLAPFMALAVLLGVAGFVASMLGTVIGAWSMGLAFVGADAAFPALAAGIAIASLLRGPLHYGEQICNHYIAFKLLALIRDKVFAALRRLAPAKLEGRDKGDLMSLVTADIELLEVFYAHTVSPVLIAAAMAVGMAVALGLQSLWFAVLTVVLYGAIALVVPFAGSRLCSRLGREQRDSVGSMNAFMLESLRGVNETIQYGCQASRAEMLDERMDALHAISVKLRMRSAVSDALTDVLVIGGDVACALIGCALLAAGAIDAPQFMIAQALVMSGFGPFIAVSRLGTTLQQTLASGERVIELVDEVPQTEEVRDGVVLKGFDGAQTNNVTFGYGEKPVFENVTMRVAPGSVVQICGRSGTGKSTLCKLLMRFWDPKQGFVAINGQDVKLVNTSSLRATQSYMTQDTHLFAGTLRDNIALVKPDATDEEILEACREADIDELIARLPDGLDAQAGELGSALSGGERQRIGLARVFLHDAPFVLLDEPTSNLDSLSEAQVLKALHRHREGKTMVLVSHRASTSSLADECYMLER